MEILLWLLLGFVIFTGGFFRGNLMISAIGGNVMLIMPFVSVIA